jgi:phosphoribosylformylglycinamidine synthase
LKGSNRGISITIDGNGRLCYLDAYSGSAIAVAEACRNLACTGAEPIAITDGLNFGNPENQDVQYQISLAVAGIRTACEVFGIPVVSGNASLYNESVGTAIYPTPIIGALGLIENVAQHVGQFFKNTGDHIVLIGEEDIHGDPRDLAGSEYLYHTLNLVAGLPRVDLELEHAVQMLCIQAIKKQIATSAHDCSDGGIAIALAESAIGGRLGAVIETPVTGRWDAALFGERQGRIVLSVPDDNVDEMATLADQAGVPWSRIGTVGGDSIIFKGLLDIPLRVATTAWEGGLARAF